MVRSDAADEMLAKETSEGLRLSSKDPGSKEKPSGMMPPSTSASARSSPLVVQAAFGGVMVLMKTGDEAEGEWDEVDGLGDDGERYSVWMARRDDGTPLKEKSNDEEGDPTDGAFGRDRSVNGFPDLDGRKRSSASSSSKLTRELIASRM